MIGLLIYLAHIVMVTAVVVEVGIDIAAAIIIITIIITGHLGGHTEATIAAAVEVSEVTDLMEEV